MISYIFAISAAAIWSVTTLISTRAVRYFGSYNYNFLRLVGIIVLFTPYVFYNWRPIYFENSNKNNQRYLKSHEEYSRISQASPQKWPDNNLRYNFPSKKDLATTKIITSKSLKNRNITPRYCIARKNWVCCQHFSWIEINGKKKELR